MAKASTLRRADAEPFVARPVPAPQDPTCSERLRFGRIYWMYGVAPKGARLRNDITEPPVNGWNHAFVLVGEKKWTIFCPVTFTSHQVSVGSMEQESFKGPREPFTLQRLASWLTAKWESFAVQGAQVDYDMAARVLRELGAPIPTVVPLAREGDETKERGGKPAADELTKPVRRDGKRGRVLDWFLGRGPRSIREAMAEFDASRSSILSYLHNLNKDHGVGYRLVGDTAEVELPAGCESPWTD